MKDHTHLTLQFIPDAPFFICLYNEVEVIEVLDNEITLFVHTEQYLLDGGITEGRGACDVSEHR